MNRIDKSTGNTLAGHRLPAMTISADRRIRHVNADGRGDTWAIVWGTSAGGRLLTVSRVDAGEKGKPYVIWAKQITEVMA